MTELAIDAATKTGPEIAPETAMAIPDDAKAMVFSFGDAESVLDSRELADYFEIYHNGKWFEPPLPMDKLAKVFNMAPGHRSSIALKVNLLVGVHQPTAQLSTDSFERTALDFLQMGNGYLESVPNRAGGLAIARHAPARHMRAPKDAGAGYFFVGANPMGEYRGSPAIQAEHQFRPGAICHLQQPDVAQEIYGLPEWLSALQAGLLNENATLFRRRYYLNGAHAGFILYVNDAFADNETADKVRQAMKSTKGVGNFKNMFFYMPGGKKDGVQLIPVGDVAAKDEFTGVKNISRDDMLTAHRVPPQLIGIVPTNAAGFGKVGEALDTFFQIEIVPIMRRMMAMNDFFGEEVLRFGNYSASDGSQITPTGERVAVS
ncbi:phage portal protein [Erythrobacter sp. EC-HK427]|uniref:phage portal protein n=1 Tax=Erythrobacter sp. EC-HK427 TaxID=2038396 RepID=UPI001255CBAD|nr:phage portal protein [Erythrobacter sp. EC-HK427]VVT07507.1 Pbsx family phage portal protein [Erythrobacter sp. EC-HK427]